MDLTYKALQVSSPTDYWQLKILPSCPICRCPREYPRSPVGCRLHAVFVDSVVCIALLVAPPVCYERGSGFPTFARCPLLCLIMSKINQVRKFHTNETYLRTKMIINNNTQYYNYVYDFFMPFFFSCIHWYSIQNKTSLQNKQLNFVNFVT